MLIHSYSHVQVHSPYLFRQNSIALYPSLFLLRVLETCYNDRIPYFATLVYINIKTDKVLCVGGGKFKENRERSKQSAESRGKEKDEMCRKGVVQ